MLKNVLNQACLHINLADGEDGYVVAECTDIPGCISQGRTREEALANIVDAISVCLSVIVEDARAKLPRATQDTSEYQLSLSTAEVLPCVNG